MNELLFYSILFVIVIGHAIAAFRMYREVNADSGMSFHEKNNWKLKALISPLIFLSYYRQDKRRRNRGE
ncbi:hypothetical protein [Algoriphagus taiwanensis]